MAYAFQGHPAPPMQHILIPPPYHNRRSPLPQTMPYPPPQGPPPPARNTFYPQPGFAMNMPPAHEPPPPMRIAGNMVINAMTGQPLYTVSHMPAPNSKRENSLFTLIHLPSGTPVGDARRHMSSSSIINIAGRSSKLKKDDGAFSERWKYMPTWSPDNTWYFKNPRKLDIRLLDAKHDGRELMTIKGGEMTFMHGGLIPAQVGELILAAVVLREDIKEDKKISDAVGEAAVDVAFA